MAYRLAVTEQFDALTAAEGKGMFWKQKSPIDLGSVDTYRIDRTMAASVTTPR